MHIALSVGQLYPNFPPGGPEGALYQYDAGGHALHVLMRRPTRPEISAYARGACTVRHVVVGPAIVVLVRCGTQPWIDAPYSWHLVSEDRRALPEALASVGLLQLVLVDTETARVRALRAVSFPAAGLHEAIRQQASSAWDERAYDRAVQALPPTEDLARQAARSST